MPNPPYPANTANPRRPAWLKALSRHSAGMRLWAALTVSDIVVLAFKQFFGVPNDGIDFFGLAGIVIVSPLILFVLLQKLRLAGTAAVLSALGGLSLLAEAVEITVRTIGGKPILWQSEAADMLGLAVLTLPWIYLTLHDIHDKERTLKKLSYLAYHDQLTGLPNRQRFLHMMDKAIRAVKPSYGRLAVLLIDLDRFKNINDTFGHASGDRILEEAANRLNAEFGDGRVSRQGGDEFAVLLEHLPDETEIEMQAKQIIKLINRIFTVDGHELRVGCSIGIAVYPEHGDDAASMIKNADTAMHRTKEQGKNGYRFYTMEMNESVTQKLVMEEWLNRALELDEFELHYQPQVDIFTGKMNGMEALLRWSHPRLGFISPGDFIPLAEETRLIIPIGEWVLRKACQQNKTWQLAGFSPLKMAVNISPIQFHQENFVQVVLDILRETDLAPRYLELEITEGIAMYHVDQVIEKLQVLRELGVHISMDDFGTGYSSLSYLKKFPIDKLKIAQQFVRDITDDPDDAAIVQAIMAMAHSLKLNVIAEGVETEEQLSFLLDIKCREIQGYIYSKPVAEPEFTELLQRMPM